MAVGHVRKAGRQQAGRKRGGQVVPVGQVRQAQKKPDKDNSRRAILHSLIVVLLTLSILTYYTLVLLLSIFICDILTSRTAIISAPISRRTARITSAVPIGRHSIRVYKRTKQETKNGD